MRRMLVLFLLCISTFFPYNLTSETFLEKHYFVKTAEFFFPRVYGTWDTPASCLHTADMRRGRTRISGFSFGPCRLDTAPEGKRKQRRCVINIKRGLNGHFWFKDIGKQMASAGKATNSKAQEKKHVTDDSKHCNR